MKFRFQKQSLVFKRPAKTSRNVLTQRPIAFLEVLDHQNIHIARGEVAPIEGLSSESWSEIDSEFFRLSKIENPLDWNSNCSSLQFAIDCVQAQLNSESIFFPFIGANNQFKIPLNGLVWMNEISTMHQEARVLVQNGFTAVKFKIGSLAWQEELKLLHDFRNEYPDIEIRVDANGAFNQEDALFKLKQLSEFGIHSIEQPLSKGNWRQMSDLCIASPVPIAFDEELIGWNEDLLHFFEQNGLPQYLILKPSLHGGITKCKTLSNWAESCGVKFWVTSYLESNVGLNHIANWVCSNNWNFRHGLGTGGLFENNLIEHWTVTNGFLIPKAL